jgi:hypothetical protein
MTLPVRRTRKPRKSQVCLCGYDCQEQVELLRSTVELLRVAAADGECNRRTAIAMLAIATISLSLQAVQTYNSFPAAPSAPVKIAAADQVSVGIGGGSSIVITPQPATASMSVGRPRVLIDNGALTAQSMIANHTTTNSRIVGM